MKRRINRWNGQLKKGTGKDRMLFKYNEDDILEILSEHLAEVSGYEKFRSRAILLGKPDKDLRLLCVVGDLEDEEIDNIDLEELDKNMDFNGTHE